MRKILIAAIVVAAFTLTGCAAHNYGTLKESHEVTRQFTEGDPVSSYAYYYYGRANKPSAVIGIDNTLKFESDLWKPVPATGDALASWIDSRTGRISTHSGSARYGGRYQGAEILDPNGRQVGVWYSKFDWGVIKFPEAGRIVVYSPEERPGALDKGSEFRNKD